MTYPNLGLAPSARWTARDMALMALPDTPHAVPPWPIAAFPQRTGGG